MQNDADSIALITALADPQSTIRLAEKLVRLARPGDALLLEGPFGAGKTVLARAFLRAATGDPTLVVPSPSYTLVQTYETTLGRVHHFDLWRLGDAERAASPQALAELGWEEARGDIVLVEWPERLGSLAPNTALHIALEITGEEARKALITGWGARLRCLA